MLNPEIYYWNQAVVKKGKEETALEAQFALETPYGKGNNCVVNYSDEFRNTFVIACKCIVQKCSGKTWTWRVL